jgi:hypothetical protein
MAQIGDRVGAIERATSDTVWFYGYGTYQGATIPPDSVGGMNFGIPNPTIKLDTGNTVYGCECWWGSESKVKEMIGDRIVLLVDPKRD